MPNDKIIECNAGFFPYTYCFCPNEQAWKRLARISKRELGEYPPLSHAAMTSFFRDYKRDKPVAVVTVADRPPPETVGLLVHEAMHVWRDMREAIGEKEPSSEFEAYTVHNIVDQLLSAYVRTRKPLFIRR
jgi:hypothetical protein